MAAVTDNGTEFVILAPLLWCILVLTEDGKLLITTLLEIITEPLVIDTLLGKLFTDTVKFEDIPVRLPDMLIDWLLKETFCVNGKLFTWAMTFVVK